MTFLQKATVLKKKMTMTPTRTGGENLIKDFLPQMNNMKNSFTFDTDVSKPFVNASNLGPNQKIN